MTHRLSLLIAAALLAACGSSSEHRSPERSPPMAPRTGPAPLSSPEPAPTRAPEPARTSRPDAAPITTPMRAPVALDGRSIIIDGKPVHIGAPVITYQDEGGFDAYVETRFFSDEVLPRSPAEGCDVPRRYAYRSDPDPRTAVDLVVVHYDVAWTSRNCFKVLHDIRGLSCHFLLDVDGTIYQTLDVAERARHAGPVNDRSVGIEIAHPGPLDLTPNLAERYAVGPDGKVRFDLGPHAPGVRSPGFIVRPARQEPISGEVHGVTYRMYDFTDPQYVSLARLLGGLAHALPRVKLEAPRASDGSVLAAFLGGADDALDPARFGEAAGVGVVGHFHVSKRKQDPGPAFDWARVLDDAREVAARLGRRGG